MPAVAGLKFPLETPGPENVPPVGKPPVKTNGGAGKQVAPNAAKLTVGAAFTTMVFEAEAAQPAAFVAV